MTGSRRLVAALLVPLGVIVSHVVAYGLAHTDGDPTSLAPSHTHFVPLTVVAVFFAAAAISLAAHAGSLGAGLRLNPARLALAQGVVFLLMELGEHLGHGSSLAQAIQEPTLRIGIAVQLAVAIAACLLVRISGVLAARLVGRPPVRPRRSPKAVLPRVAVFVAQGVSLSTLSRRGPPRPRGPILSH